MNENHDSINAIKHLKNSLERCDFNSIKDILNCKKEQEEIKENILKELKEEAGVEAKVERLLAVFDSNKHQLQATQFFKLCFLCTALSTDFEPNTEIIEVAYFAIDQLPDLSTKRITRRQLEILMTRYKAGGQVYLD